MLKKDAVAYFGTQEKLALALGITRQAVQAWGQYIPLGRAYQLSNLTDGKLEVKLKKRRNGKAVA